MRKGPGLTLLLVLVAGLASARQSLPKIDFEKAIAEEKALQTLVETLTKDRLGVVLELEKKKAAAKTATELAQIAQERKAGDVECASRLLEAAGKYSNAPNAALAAINALHLGCECAVPVLVEKFQNDTRVLRFFAHPGNRTAHTRKLMALLAEKADDRKIRGAAAFLLAEQAIQELDYPPDEKFQPPAEIEKAMAVEAKKLREVIRTYGDVPTIYWLSGAGTVRQEGEKLLALAERLSVGKPLPDGTATTLDGKPVKVSDLKGKVAVLDFWTLSCGPCRRMIPHQRDMVARLKDKPFELVSINVGDKKASLQKFVEDQKMTWTHWQVPRQKELAATCSVSYYPTIFILDAKGIIRYKNLRGKELEAAVTALLKEAEEKPLSAIEARKKVGSEITVEMQVMAAKDRREKRGEIYLDAAEDFKSDKNFAVVITRKGADSLKAAGIDDPAAHFKSKTIRASGTVKEVDGIPRIEVDAAKQIRLVTH